MKTVEFNDQQVDFIKFVLEDVLLGADLSKTSKVIIGQIISKLEE